MITDLWIENFKGIGKRQHIPLRPITLLFGTNSAGKSTVLHALLYLREIVCRQNVNPTKPLEGEQTVNLGGFRNLVHRSASETGESTSAVVLGMKITESESAGGQSLNLATQYEFFSNDTAFHGHRWLDPEIGDSYLRGLPDMDHSYQVFNWQCDPDAQI